MVMTPRNIKLLLNEATPVFFNTARKLTPYYGKKFFSDISRKKIEVFWKNNEDLKLLVQKGEYPTTISKILSWSLDNIYKVSPQLITEENIALLLQNEEYAHAITRTLESLLKRNPQLVTKEIFTSLVQNGEYLSHHLYSIGQMSFDAQRKICRKQESYSKNLGDVLEGLYKINPQLLTKENFALLAKRGHNLDEVACLFAGLREIKHPQLLVTKESFDLLTKNWGDFYATATADALQVIK